MTPALDAVLTQAQADPSSVGTSSGAIATLKRDARLFNHWSTHASTTVTGTTISFLPVHLLTASISLRILASGYRDPSAGTYAASAPRT
jgi:hypothetical protein